MSKRKTKHVKYPRRPLSELNLIDDFLFQQLLSQGEDGEEACRILLSTILGRRIRRVRIVPQKSVLGIDTDKHGIRMDAYIEEVSEEAGGEIDAQVIPDIYDLEPNNTYEKKSLPKRIRYYHGLIDAQVLASDTDYDKLPNVVIIIILPYDPFGRGRMVYTVQNQCIEDTTIPYDDGARKIFLYTRGTEGNPSQELKDMLKYIEKSTDANVTNGDIASLQRIVTRVKQKKEVSINYMKSWEREKMIHDEGVQQGIEIGKAQGLEQGILGMIQSARAFQVPKEQVLAQLQQQYKLEPAQAEEYMKKYW